MSTTNLNLDTLSGGEKIKLFPQVFNGDMEAIDAAVGPGFSSSRSVASVSSAEEASMAYVSNNNTHVAIPAGRFVYVKNHGSLAEGLYESKSDIATNGVLSGSNLTAVSNGGLNALREKFPTLFEKNMRSATTMAQLATDISTYKTYDIILYAINADICTALVGSSVTLNGVVLIYKISDSTAYYALFYRSAFASGNISLSNGAVTIQYSSINVAVKNVSSTSDLVTVPSGQNTEICGIPLDVGHYIIVFHAYWGTNQNGRRNLIYSETAGGSRKNLASEVSVNAVVGGATQQQLVIMDRIEEAKTIHFVAWQNSGSDVSLTPRYSITRLR